MFYAPCLHLTGPRDALESGCPEASTNDSEERFEDNLASEEAKGKQKRVSSIGGRKKRRCAPTEDGREA